MLSQLPAGAQRPGSRAERRRHGSGARPMPDTRRQPPAWKVSRVRTGRSLSALEFRLTPPGGSFDAKRKYVFLRRKYRPTREFWLHPSVIAPFNLPVGGGHPREPEVALSNVAYRSKPPSVSTGRDACEGAVSEFLDGIASSQARGEMTEGRWTHLNVVRGMCMRCALCPHITAVVLMPPGPMIRPPVQPEKQRERPVHRRWSHPTQQAASTALRE